MIKCIISRYISKLRQAMIVLEESNVFELFYTFSCTYGCSWVLRNPLLNQINAKLSIKKKNREIISKQNMEKELVTN